MILHGIETIIVYQYLLVIRVSRFKSLNKNHDLNKKNVFKYLFFKLFSKNYNFNKNNC